MQQFRLRVSRKSRRRYLGRQICSSSNFFQTSRPSSPGKNTTSDRHLNEWRGSTSGKDRSRPKRPRAAGKAKEAKHLVRTSPSVPPWLGSRKGGPPKEGLRFSTGSAGTTSGVAAAFGKGLAGDVDVDPRWPGHQQAGLLHVDHVSKNFAGEACAKADCRIGV